MLKNTQVKAMNQEEAVQRALNILEAKEYQIVEVKVLEKPKSFLGLFNKVGCFDIIVDINKKPETKAKETKTELGKNEKTVENIKTPKKEKAVLERESLDTEKKEKEHSSKKVEEAKKEERVIEEIDVEAKVKTLLDLIGLDLQVETHKVSERHYQISLLGEDNGIIIGKKGKTLHSFEYLLNSMYKEYRIELDVEGFKEKRSQTLRELGKKMAEKCIKTKKTIRLNPMPAKERKIIHEILNQYEALETYSEGRDPKRYIVIKYARKK